jgi:SAM-dependent methyltransferase
METMKSSHTDAPGKKILPPFLSDTQFDQLYPASIQALSSRHWTPLEVAREASRFLATGSSARILDIGSGAGKFCLVSAYYHPNAIFYGVEQRRNMINLSNGLKDSLNISNVHFLHGNFTQLDFRNYDSFYYFNSFYENLAGTDKIDQELDYSLSLYNYYNRYLYQLLHQKPAGTRLVTFHSLEGEVPQNYHVVNSQHNERLKFWIKI